MCGKLAIKWNGLHDHSFVVTGMHSFVTCSLNPSKWAVV